MNKEFLVMRNKDDINEALLCSRLGSTGAQPASVYGLAEVLKQGTSLRPVLFLPVSLNGHLNKHTRITSIKLRGLTWKRILK